MEYINNIKTNKNVSNAIHINKPSIIILLKYLKLSIIRDQNKKRAQFLHLNFLYIFLNCKILLFQIIQMK